MPGFQFGLTVGLLSGSAGFYLNCTVGQFYLLSILGWLAAPLILTCRFGFSVARGTPILAGGIGVARFVAGAFLCLLSFV